MAKVSKYLKTKFENWTDISMKTFFYYDLQIQEKKER